MCESTVTFSIKTDLNGNIKISYDGANKKVIGDDGLSQRLSPCSSLRSLDVTNDSEVLVVGVRRRVHSSSNDSCFTSDSSTVFDSNEILRSSSPYPRDDLDTISNASFISCVSELSNVSIVTDSSQETIKSDSNRHTVNRKNFSENSSRWRKKSVSYEEKNKERYSGYVEGDWRSAMKSPKDSKMIFSNQRKSLNSINSPLEHYRANATSHFSSNNSKSRIPFLKTRPTYKSPNSAVSPSSVISSPSSVATKSPSRSANCARSPLSSDRNGTIKLTIITEPDGQMKIRFLNHSSQELWAVDGMSDYSKKIDVRKI